MLVNIAQVTHTHAELLQTLRKLEHSFAASVQFLESDSEPAPSAESNPEAQTQVLWVGSRMLQGLLQVRLSNFEQLECSLRSGAIGQSKHGVEMLRGMRSHLKQMCSFDGSLAKEPTEASAESHLSVLVSCAQHMDSLIGNYERIITELYQRKYG